MTKIFISYSRVDEKNFVEPLVAVLREHYEYANVWYDRHLIGGQNWWDEILRQIKEADVFLWLLSNDAVNSEYCLAEYEEAQRLGKPVITVQVRDHTHIPPEIGEIQFVDMSGGSADIGNSLKIINLIKAIDYQADQPTPRRPKWRPATPCPDIPDPDEEANRQSDDSAHLPVINAPRQKASRVSRTTTNFLLLGLVIILLGFGMFIVPTLLGDDAKTTTTPTTVSDLNGTDTSSSSTTNGCRTPLADDATPYPVNNTNTEEMPFYFTRLPVDLSKLQSMHYYGNTVLAYKYGQPWGYDTIFQGLHSGLDFVPCDSSEGVTIFAGVTGVITQLDIDRSYLPGHIDIEIGDYVVIFGNINPRAFHVGQEITPNTNIGTIPTEMNGNDKLHLEIRYQGQEVVNPLQFFPENLQTELIQTLPPSGNNGFYSSDEWQDWQEPLDQPTIQLNGPVIGPRG